MSGPRIAIVGSRRRTDPETVRRIVLALPPDAIVVSGGCRGPDRWAEDAARARGLAVMIFRPDLAGVRCRGEAAARHHARNQRIVDAANAMIAFVAPDRRGGTEDAIRRARRKGIPITIVS